MFLESNPLSFLSGEDPFLPVEPVECSGDRFDAGLVFENHHEGFIGIPHGGLGMGLCLDAWRRIGRPSYPVRVRFKFGGSGISIGDPAIFTVEKDVNDGSPRVIARITKGGDRTPYLRAEISPSAVKGDSVPVMEVPADRFRDLPFYRNCFVCGHHRTVAGLQRRFRFHESATEKLVTTGWGLHSDDFDRAQRFLIAQEELHPAVLISIFDENTAWGGFMETGSAGLSVRLDFTLLRPVGRCESLLFVGKPAGVRGNPRAPRFFLAEGTILAMNDPGNPETVAFGRGEWIIMDHYTAQIKKNLLPEGDWDWIFRNGSLPER